MINKIFRLKTKIALKDYILSGTIAKQYKQCGKVNCRCQEGKEYWHGPYWIWTRKEGGKTITKTLSKEQAKLVKKAIADMKELNDYIDKWKRLTLKEIEKI